MRFFKCLIYFLFIACYVISDNSGTFRTAKAVEKNKWVFEAGLGFGLTESGYPYYFPASLGIRGGFFEGFDMGIKVVPYGLELILFKQFLFEKNNLFYPSAGLSLGLSPFYSEIEVIMSKNFSNFSPYFAFNLSHTLYKIFTGSINIGFQIKIREFFILPEYSSEFLYIASPVWGYKSGYSNRHNLYMLCFKYAF